MESGLAFMDILKTNKLAWDKIGSKVASPYIKKRKYKSMFDLFCRKLKSGSSVLDLGCGSGIPVTRELVKKGFRVTGVDISDTMIKVARRNVPQAKYVRSSMTDIKFNGKFDGIVSSYSMICLDVKNFKKSSRKIAAALKPGGFFFLALNEPSSSGDGGFEKVIGQRMYVRSYTEKEIRFIFKSGLKVLKVERDVVVSKTYGKEHSLLILMQKVS